MGSEIVVVQKFALRRL